MKRRTTAFGGLVVALATITALSASSAAFAAGAGPAVSPTKVNLSSPRTGTVLPDLQLIRTATMSAPARQALGTEAALSQRSVSKPVPKGSRGAVPYAPPPYPTVGSLPIVNAVGKVPLATTGVTGYEQRAWGGYSLEPPDTELCAGNGYIMQTVNNIIEVYDTAGNELSAPIPAEYFFDDFVNFLFDPKCYWDPDTKHFFITWAVSDFDSFSGVLIAVSQTGNPLGGWNIYFLDTTDPFENAGCYGDTGVPCLGDQPLLGADKWTLQISTNEFPLVGGFNGAEMFFIDKTALGLGLPSPNVVGFDLGDVTTPDGDCPTDSSGAPCWYSVQPAESSNANYATGMNGTAYAMSALDFFGANDNRIALWSFVNTRSISGFSPVILGTVGTLTTGAYGMPPFAVQPEGDNPLGEALGISSVRDIQTNDDRMQEVDWNNRTGWLMGGLNTGVCVTSCSTFRAGIEWFALKLHWFGSSLFVTQKNGYIANRHADVIFPASTTVNSGNGVWAYSLTGDTIYPSAAFSPFSNTSSPNAIVISHQGVGPQDGFTEYSDVFFGSYRPRWGDYSGAVTDGNRMYWATEFIDQTCDLTEYNATSGYCGGERGPNLNWANSLAGTTG